MSILATLARSSWRESPLRTGPAHFFYEPPGPADQCQILLHGLPKAQAGVQNDRLGVNSCQPGSGEALGQKGTYVFHDILIGGRFV